MDVLSFLGAGLFRDLALFLEVALLGLSCFVIFEGYRRIGRHGVSLRIMVVVLLALTAAFMSGAAVIEGLLGD